MSRATAWALVRAVAVHPGLWGTAVAEAFRLRRRHWWRTWPPLPLPTDELWRFRMITAYGGEGNAVPRQQDVVSFLGWCRDMCRWRRT